MAIYTFKSIDRQDNTIYEIEMNGAQYDLYSESLTAIKEQTELPADGLDLLVELGIANPDKELKLRKVITQVNFSLGDDPQFYRNTKLLSNGKD